MRVVAAILGAMIACSASAHAETVVWLTPAYPPAYITRDTGYDARWRGDGFAQQIERWFVGHIPGYESVELEASMSRIMALMQSGDRLYCLATTNPAPGRAAFMALSASLYLQPGNRVAVLNERVPALTPHLTADGAVDLPQLAADARLAGTIVAGRSYSPVIDPVLARAPALERQTSIETPPKLLLAGRTDWIIAYPRELEWAWRAEGGTGEERPYRTYPVAGDPRFTANHIGCTKTRAGQQFIERVDAAIAAHPDRPWRLHMLAWLNEADRLDVERAERHAAR